MAMRLILCLFLIASLSGCGNLFNQHAAMMDVMRGAISEASNRLGSSSVGQYAAGAQVIDPGIEIEAGMKYFASARYKGVAGQITASAQGNLDRELTDQQRATILRIYANTALTGDQKRALALELITTWMGKDAPTPEPTPEPVQDPEPTPEPEPIPESDPAPARDPDTTPPTEAEVTAALEAARIDRDKAEREAAALRKLVEIERNKAEAARAAGNVL